MFAKNLKTIVLFVVFLFLSIETSSGVIVKNPDFVNKNYCRNHIFHPRCRGQQKRDLLNRPSEELRLTPLEPEFSERRDLALDLNSPTLLRELFKKVADSSREYDSENGNYLK